MSKYFADIWYGVVTTLIGLKVTLKHMLTREVTIQYPEVKHAFPDRFRGMLFNDINSCISCDLCSKACPADCFHMTGAGKGKGRYAPEFDIHIYKCLWCGFCTEACPTGSLVMSKDYEVAGYDRDCMILNFGEGERPEGDDAPVPGTMPKVPGPALTVPRVAHEWVQPWQNNPKPIAPKAPPEPAPLAQEAKPAPAQATPAAPPPPATPPATPKPEAEAAPAKDEKPAAEAPPAKPKPEAAPAKDEKPAEAAPSDSKDDSTPDEGAKAAAPTKSPKKSGTRKSASKKGKSGTRKSARKNKGR